MVECEGGNVIVPKSTHLFYITVFIHNEPFRALVDNGSMHSFIDADIAKRLQLSSTPIEINIKTINGVHPQSVMLLSPLKLDIPALTSEHRSRLLHCAQFSPIAIDHLHPAPLVMGLDILTCLQARIDISPRAFYVNVDDFQLSVPLESCSMPDPLSDVVDTVPGQLSDSARQSESVESDLNDTVISSFAAIRALRKPGTCLYAVTVTGNPPVNILGSFVGLDEPIVQFPIECSDSRYTSAFQQLLAQFGDVFPSELPSFQGQHRPSMRIPTDSSYTGKATPNYRIPERAHRWLRSHIADLAKKGYLSPSFNSTANSPILVVQKPPLKPGDEPRWRMVNDFRALNANTHKVCGTLPHPQTLLARLSGHHVYSSLDLFSGYFQFPLHKDDQWKTTFTDDQGCKWCYTVCGMGLSHSGQHLQNHLQHLLGDLHEFVVVYSDNIAIFSDTYDDHLRHLTIVLNRLRDDKLFCQPLKCSFATDQLEYLGWICNEDGRCPSPTKVQCIVDFPLPVTKRDCRSFLGLIGFYRSLLPEFERHAGPLRRLTHNDQPDRLRQPLSPEVLESIDALKRLITTAPVLQFVDTTKPIVLHVDASGTHVSGCLMQDIAGHLHPCEYLSHSLEAKSHLPIYYRELYAIVFSLQRWRHYLQFSPFTIDIRSDHNPLRFIKEQKRVPSPVAQWLNTLAEFDFDITYIGSRDNKVADCLSRPPRSVLTDQLSLLADNETACLATVTTVDSPDLLQKIREAYGEDKYLHPVLDALSSCDIQAHPHYHRRYFLRDGLLFLHPVDTDKPPRLVVPSDSDIINTLIKEAHTSKPAGHCGRDQTYHSLVDRFYFHKMSKLVRQFVQRCAVCQHNKPAQHVASAGQRLPLPIPERPFSSISYDLITALPACGSAGFTCIYTVVCQLTGCVHFKACHLSTNSADMAQLFLDTCFKHRGLPHSLVSDRDPRVTSHFYSSLFTKLGSQLCLSTSQHPQTDGKSENLNRYVEGYLRNFCSYYQDDWVDLLPLAEFCWNSHKSSSTGYSPFELTIGYNPLTPMALLNPIPCEDLSSSDGWIAFRARALEHAQDMLVYSQLLRVHQADKRLYHVPFHVGDYAYVHRDYLVEQSQRSRPSFKLSHRYSGPFRIIAEVNPVAFTLDLPPYLKCHNTFHVSALKPHVPTSDAPLPLCSAVVDSQPPDSPEYFVDVIHDHRFNRRTHELEFLTEWLGFPIPSSFTWEPLASFVDIDPLLGDVYNKTVRDYMIAHDITV